MALSPDALTLGGLSSIAIGALHFWRWLGATYETDCRFRVILRKSRFAVSVCKLIFGTCTFALAVWKYENPESMWNSDVRYRYELGVSLAFAVVGLLELCEQLQCLPSGRGPPIFSLTGGGCWAGGGYLMSSFAESESHKGPRKEDGDLLADALYIAQLALIVASFADWGEQWSFWKRCQLQAQR